VKDQLDLFNRDKAKDARDEAIDRVDEHADEDWKSQMYHCAVRVAQQLPFFTTDEVYLMAARIGITAETHEHRALGPVMLALARQDLIRKALMPPRLSIRQSRHAAPLQVWESLIHRVGRAS
jgi:hypothetical protein